MALSSEQACHIHDVGAVSELMVRGYLTSCGYETYGPDKLHARADLVYVKKGKPVRVQVKTATFSTTGKYRYEQCRLNKKGYKGALEKQTSYSAEDVEEIWVVGTHLWCFPIELAGGRPSLFLSSTNPEPRCLRRDYDPNDFIVVTGSPERPFRLRLTTNESYEPPFMGIKK